MNARNQQFQLIVDCRQVRDVTLCAFHTILFHRTIGKFKYSSDQNFSFGLLGYEDVKCGEIDLTYIRVNSPELVADLDVKVNDFSDAIQSVINNGYLLYGSPKSHQSLQHSSPGREGRLYGIESWETLFPAQIKLEFYQKRRRQWPIPEDHVPWEIWELQLDIVRTNNDDFQRMKEFVGEKLSEAVLSVCEIINKPQYLPKMPTRAELPYVFEDRYRDCSPYLYRIESRHGSSLNDGGTSRGSFMRKLLSDTFAFTAS